jgi:thymidylate synthase ThyX
MIRTKREKLCRVILEATNEEGNPHSGLKNVMYYSFQIYNCSSFIMHGFLDYKLDS